jgi:fructosamine-3-kinase
MLPLYPKVPANIYDGYHSRTPLPEDFALRQPVYQLYYLLNRSNLFGGQHLVVAQRAVERLLRSDDL